MPQRSHTQSFEFTYATKAQPKPERVGEGEDRIRVLIVGDFTGRESRGDLEPLAERGVTPVDIDSLDALPKKMQTRIRFSDDGPLAGCDISIDSLEDLHADRLLELVAPLAELRTFQQRLRRGETAKSILAELRGRGWVGAEAGSSNATEANDDDAAKADEESSDDTLSRLLGKPAAARKEKRQTPAGFDAWLKRTIAPHITAARDPEQDELAKLIDELLHESLRAALADRHFRAVEGAWRSLHGLLTRIEDDELLALRLFDVGRNELAHFAESGAIALPRPRGPVGWSLIIIDPTIGANDADAAMLQRIGESVSDDAVIIAGADATHLGFDSFPERLDLPREFAPSSAFDELRTSVLAKRIGLALPPVRWRQPYGPVREPVDELESFDEWSDGPPTGIGEASGAWPVALMLLRAATDTSLGSHAGWIDDLPALSRKEGSEIVAYPSTASWLSEEAASRIAAAGYIPLQAAKGRGAVAILTAPSLTGDLLPALDRG